jgi:hypothetical protein
MKRCGKLAVLAVFAFAVVSFLEWSPWSDSGKPAPKAKSNIHMSYISPLKGRSSSVTTVYAGKRQWIEVKHSDRLVRKGRRVYARLRSGERIISGYVTYVSLHNLKARGIKWNGRGSLPLVRKLKLVKGGKRQKVRVNEIYLGAYSPKYLLPDLRPAAKPNN